MENGKMDFKTFVREHQQKLPKLNMQKGSPGYMDLIRSWNSFVIVFPEKCMDFVFWGIDKADPELMPVIMNNSTIKETVQPVPVKKMAEIKVGSTIDESNRINLSDEQ